MRGTQGADPLSGVRVTSSIGRVEEPEPTQEETDGRYVEVEVVIDPGAGGAPRHVHPEQEERFEVTDGRLKSRKDLRSLI